MTIATNLIVGLSILLLLIVVAILVSMWLEARRAAKTYTAAMILARQRLADEERKIAERLRVNPTEKMYQEWNSKIKDLKGKQ